MPFRHAIFFIDAVTLFRATLMLDSHAAAICCRLLLLFFRHAMPATATLRFH